MATSVAIIGAGCAGLGAATELTGQKEVEVDVTLIEANNWIGGRARTNPNPELPVDLGPQFVQDPEINPWTVILRQMPQYKGMKIQPIAMDTLYRVFGENQQWSTLDTNRGIDSGNKLLERGYQSATGYKNAAIMTFKESEVFDNQPDLRLSLASSGYGAIAESAEPWRYVASDRERESEHQPKVPGNIYVPNGLGNLVKSYGEKLLASNPVILRLINKVVNRIDDSKRKKMFISTMDDTEIEADFCILTVPVSAMEMIEFIPALSGPRVRANSFIKLGSYKKVAFRPTKFPSGSEDDSIKEETEYYVYDSINDGVWQYFRLPTSPDILICVAAGDLAHRLDGEDPDAVWRMLIDLLNAAYSEGDFTPQKQAVVVTNWSYTDHIHGAYSYTHCDERLDRDNPVPLEARLEIARPQGRIHFAGEATWADAYGTIHGAYHSGVRAANEVLDRIKSASS